MAGKIFLKSGGIAALATALAALSMPITAIAQDRGTGFRGAFNQRAAEASAQSAPSDGDQRASRRARADNGQRAQQAAPAARQQGGERRWEGRGDGSPGRQARAQANRAQANQTNHVERRDDGRRGRIDRDRSGPGFRGVLDIQRDGQRDGRRVDNRRGRGDNRWDRNDSRRWDNNWRRDRRYDWHGYRNSNRHAYRIGRYHAPYRNYYYRPLSIGFHLDSLFFGSSYWINDPWQYRLPPAYGPYRWVRYYDDVLLVDIYSGEVVDVIRGFFW